MDGLRPLTRSDLPWVVELAAARRRKLVAFAPRFWRPAAGATTAHKDFLGTLVDAAEVLAVRSEHGFLFGLPHGNRLLVDDFALEDEDHWATDGLSLLRRADAEGALRVVCPVPENDRRAVVETLGATVAESWWHRDLDSSNVVATATESTIKVDGAEGRLVEAPPVYAPGGPVALVTTVRDQRALRDIERASARRGASVSVVALTPGDGRGSELLEDVGYRQTTDFYETPLRRS